MSGSQSGSLSVSLSENSSSVSDSDGENDRPNILIDTNRDVRLLIDVDPDLNTGDDIVLASADNAYSIDTTKDPIITQGNIGSVDENKSKCCFIF